MDRLKNLFLSVRFLKFKRGHTHALLIGIFILAVFLRFYHLGSLPPSLTWDEAAWGYNAYTLGIDGKDEFGRFLPLTYLESFGDFKPPLYAYLTVIPVKVLGLTEFATRFPSALFGSLTVLLTYYLVKEVFYKEEKKREMLALLSAFILAISPWHILLSRAAFEANVSTFFIVFGVCAFLHSLHHKQYFLMFSLISFVLSCYTFNTARIVSPLLVIVLMIMNYKYLFLHKYNTLFACIVAFIIFLPLLFFLQTPQARLRFQEVNIFTDSSVVARANKEISNDQGIWWSKILHNRRLQYGVEYVKHYFDNLNPQYLFIKGDGNPKFSIQDVGELYIWEIPFLMLGILALFRNREGKWWIIPIWLIIGMVPAAAARETPHALRTEASLPTFQILSAYGLYTFFSLIKKIEVRRYAYIFVSIIIFISFVYFYHSYTVHYATEYSGEWQYGYKESLAYIREVEGQYDEVQFTQKLGRPYIYYLFYNQKNPDELRNNSDVTREVLGFVHVNSIGKYKFPEKMDVSKNSDKHTLYVNDPFFVPKDAKKLKEFKLLNGVTVLVAYTL